MTGYVVQARKALIAVVSLGLLTAGVISAPAKADTPARNLTIHYYRTTVDSNAESLGVCVSDPCGNYDGWNFWVWQTGASPDPNGTTGLQFDSTDKFGVKATFAVGNGATNVGFLVRIGYSWDNAQKSDIADDRFIALKATGNTEVWVKEGDPVVYTSNPNDRVLRIHYHRSDHKYAGWSIQTQEANPVDNKVAPFSKTSDCFGRVAMIQVPEISQMSQGYILRKGGDSATLKSHLFTATLSSKKYTDVWLDAKLFMGEDIVLAESDDTLDMAQMDANPQGNLVVVHYSRPLMDYAHWSMKTLADGMKHAFTPIDSGFGRLACIHVPDLSIKSTVIKITKRSSKVDLAFGEKPTGLGGQRTIDITGPVTEVWLKQGYSTVWAKQQASDPAIQSAQRLTGVVSSLTRGQSVALPLKTNAKLAVTWLVLTPSNCKIKSGRLIAKDAGTCKLNVTQKGNAAYMVFTSQYRIIIK